MIYKSATDSHIIHFKTNPLVIAALFWSLQQYTAPLIETRHLLSSGQRTNDNQLKGTQVLYTAFALCWSFHPFFLVTIVG